MSIQSLSLFAFVALAACGGSDSDPYQEAVSAANKKEAEARAAGVTSPCADTSQCGVLTFQSPTPTCANWSYKPYSLVSPTAAAASAAAQEENVPRSAGARSRTAIEHRLPGRGSAGACSHVRRKHVRPLRANARGG